MAHEIQYSSDKSGGVEKASGSDNRFNVSSRADSRGAYNSRDESLAFNLLWDDSDAEAGDYIAYWKNTDTTGKDLVLSTIGVNAAENSSFKLHVVTGVAADGVTLTPTCSNRVRPKSAQALAMGANGTPISGLLTVAELDHVACPANGHGEMLTDDRIRVGQDQAIVIEYEQGTTGRAWGRISGYYE